MNQLKRYFTRVRFLIQVALANPKAVPRHLSYVFGGWAYPRYKRRVVILPCAGGLGDNLMLTAVAHEVRRRNHKALIHVITAYPEVFARNPDVDFVNKWPAGSRPWKKSFPVRYNHDFPWKRHFLHTLCATIDIRTDIKLKNFVYLTEADSGFAEGVVRELGSQPILISRTAGNHDSQRKTWPESHWLSLVSKLLTHGPVIEVGLTGQPLPLQHPNFHNFHGHTTFHQFAALVAHSKAVITMDSAANHLAAAFSIPTICILGGIFPFEAIKYPRTKVIVDQPACMHCWPKQGCAHEVCCLRNITPDQVLVGLSEYFPEYSQPWCPTKSTPLELSAVAVSNASSNG